MKTVTITETIPAGTKKTIYEIEDVVYDKVVEIIEGGAPELADVDMACE